jgi:hypothetical protein
VILKEIVDAIRVINLKVDEIAKTMGPFHGIMEKALANCAFDKDLISFLMQAASKDLANLEAESYAKYIEGMTELGKKRGIREAAEFSAALNKLETMVPDSFLADVQAKHAQILAWQAVVDEKFNESRKQMADMSENLRKFHEMAVEYSKQIHGAAKSAAMQMEKSRLEVREEMLDAINGMNNATKADMEEIRRIALKQVSDSKKEMSVELAKAKSELEKTVLDMENKRELLEDLARKAGENIIETGRIIARNSNQQPRSGRGRRNN